MTENKKLHTAEELLELFNDLERLKSKTFMQSPLNEAKSLSLDYRYSQPVISESGIDNEKFHLELPFEEIK